MVSRRLFLRNSGVALLSLGFAPSFLARTAEAAGARRKILIAIFQRGAVDGLNMIVPFGDRGYYASRPSIAIARPGSGDGAAIDLDGFFGLHPRLAPLAPLYKDGRLAIVHACGSHDSTRSHFDAQDYMETATPGIKSTQDGWLNRCVHEMNFRLTASAKATAVKKAEATKTPFRAVALTQQMPRILQGTAPALAMNQIEQFGIRAGGAGATVQSSFESEYAAAADAVLNATGREAFNAIRILEKADPARYEPAGGVMYPRTPFGQALKQIAQLVRADVGLEIAFAESGGWDHHIYEGAATGQIATRLDDLARGLAALTGDLGDRLDDVVILTMSEFGRAVAENGNRGTDHGHGNAMMAIGGGVRGAKVYGQWPGLEIEQRFERRDLAVTTDFRDVFGEVVVRHLGIANPRGIFPGYRISQENFRGFLRT